MTKRQLDGSDRGIELIVRILRYKLWFMLFIISEDSFFYTL